MQTDLHTRAHICRYTDLENICAASKILPTTGLTYNQIAGDIHGIHI